MVRPPPLCSTRPIAPERSLDAQRAGGLERSSCRGEEGSSSASAEERLPLGEPSGAPTGGTSDARFIKNHCAVAEFGLIGRTMHKTNECVDVAEIDQLADIYNRVLVEFFSD